MDELIFILFVLIETGVGSGTVWREERLFATEEEANEFYEKYFFLITMTQKQF